VGRTMRELVPEHLRSAHVGSADAIVIAAADTAGGAGKAAEPSQAGGSQLRRFTPGHPALREMRETVGTWYPRAAIPPR
jgi:hypothetical protein